jgi:hypothetical protein
MESFGLTVSFSLYGDLLGINSSIEAVEEDTTEVEEEFVEEEVVEEPEDEDFEGDEGF